MGGLDHGPAVKVARDKASGYKQTLGIWLFLIYCVVYAGFVAINVIDASIMESLIGGQNVAIVYGFGLIIFALILAVFYNFMCGAAEKRMG